MIQITAFPAEWFPAKRTLDFLPAIAALDALSVSFVMNKTCWQCSLRVDIWISFNRQPISSSSARSQRFPRRVLYWSKAAKLKQRNNSFIVDLWCHVVLHKVSGIAVSLVTAGQHIFPPGTGTLIEDYALYQLIMFQY